MSVNVNTLSGSKSWLNQDAAAHFGEMLRVSQPYTQKLP